MVQVVGQESRPEQHTWRRRPPSPGIVGVQGHGWPFPASQGRAAGRWDSCLRPGRLAKPQVLAWGRGARPPVTGEVCGALARLPRFGSPQPRIPGEEACVVSGRLHQGLLAPRPRPMTQPMAQPFGKAESHSAPSQLPRPCDLTALPTGQRGTAELERCLPRLGGGCRSRGAGPPHPSPGRGLRRPCKSGGKARRHHPQPGWPTGHSPDPGLGLVASPGTGGQAPRDGRKAWSSPGQRVQPGASRASHPAALRRRLPAVPEPLRAPSVQKVS